MFFCLCRLSVLPIVIFVSLSLSLRVALSLEAKLQMLHSYMTVTWLPLPCEVKMESHTAREPLSQPVGNKLPIESLSLDI